MLTPVQLWGEEATSINVHRWYLRVYLPQLSSVQYVLLCNRPHFVRLFDCPPRGPIHLEAWLHCSNACGTVKQTSPVIYADLPGLKASEDPATTVPMEVTVTSWRPNIVVVRGRWLHLLELIVCGNTEHPCSSEQCPHKKIQETQVPCSRSCLMQKVSLHIQDHRNWRTSHHPTAPSACTTEPPW